MTAEFEHKTPDEAMELLLGQTISGSLGQPQRHFLRDDKLAARAVEQAGNSQAAGELLYDTLAQLPEDVAAWSGKGLASYVEDPREHALLAIFGASGADIEVATSFVTRLDSSPFGSGLPEGIARLAISRSWNVQNSNPIAGAIIAKALSATLSSNSFRSMLDQRYWGIKRMASNSDERMMAYHSMLTELAEDGSMPEHLSAVAQDRLEAIKEETRWLEEKQRQADLIARATEAIVQAEMDDATYIALLAPGGVVQAIGEFSPQKALAFEMALNRRLLAQGHSQLETAVLERQDSLLSFLASSKGQDPLPLELRSVVMQELCRRIDQIGASEHEQLKPIAELATQIGVDVASAITRRRGIIRIGEERHRQRQATLQELGFTSSEMPPEVASFNLYVSSAYLEYDSVPAVLADIEKHFVTSGETVDARTRTIFETIKAEMNQWADQPDRPRWGRRKTKPEFMPSADHVSGQIYNYSGTSFYQKVIRVQAVDNKYHLNITNSRPFADQNSPSSNLIDFAKALNKEEDLNYAGPPVLQLEVRPDDATLDTFRSMPEEQLEHLPFGSGRMHSTSTPLALGTTIRWYQKILGLPETGEGFNHLSPAVVEQANKAFIEHGRSWDNGASFAIGDDGQEITVSTYPGEASQLDASGNLHVTTSLHIDDAGERRVTMTQVRIALAPSNDVSQHRAMVQRAVQYRSVVGEGKLPPEWMGVGSTGLLLDQR